MNGNGAPPLPSRHQRTLPFTAAPCACVRTHVPRPIRVELHHVFPQADQRRIWGRVRDHRVEPLCDTGHANVHAYLDYLLGKRARPDVGPYIRQVAQEGYDRIRRAEAMMVASEASGASGASIDTRAPHVHNTGTPGGDTHGRD